MKKNLGRVILILILISIVIVMVWWIARSDQDDTSESSIQFTKSNDKIRKTKVIDTDLQNEHQDEHHGDTQQFTPKLQDRPQKTKVEYQGREVIGQEVDDYSKLVFVNSPSIDWQKKLGEELLRFQKDNTSTIIKPLKSLIRIKKNKARYIEKVLITYKMPNKTRNSYNAFIDSESGLVLETWNRTIHHTKPKKIKLQKNGEE